MCFRASMSRFSNIARYREVANILIKHGFGSLFETLGMGRFRDKLKRNWIEREVEAYSRPQHLRLALEELGPTYIKLGQLLSIRPDLLGPDYIRELEKLQDSVPPFSLEAVFEICESSGINIEQDFQFFNPEPIAAASIAQVHEGVLNSGEKIVIKVQRPGIDKIIETDLDILVSLARLLEKRTSWGRLYRPSEVVQELGEAIRNEVDFTKEARNADIFRKNFKNDPNVKIPRVFWELSSQRVLTLEYLEGIKISSFTELKKANFDTRDIADKLVHAIFKQIFEHGFFHADPHPGNLAIAEDNKVIFYDFGQVGTVDEILKETCLDLLLSMMRYDANGVTRAILGIAISNNHINRAEFRWDVARLQQKYYGLPMSQIKIGESIAELLELSTRYQLRIPAELSLMAKMLMTIESLISRLDPQLSIVDIAEPYGRKVIMNRYSPHRVKGDLRDLFLDYSRVIKNFPYEAENILKLLSEGELKVRTEHVNLNRATAKFDIMSNRLSVAIIVASIIIGSSLIVEKTSSSLISKIPLVEAGFITAMILGLVLIYSIIKSGKY